MLNKAIEIANSAHEGQVDKGGEPYILHPLRVMISRKNELEKICAVLHDVIEDSDVTIDELRKAGFTEEVISVLDCLTKQDGESYDGFIARIIENETACHVKLADLYDNMFLTRIKNPTKRDKERIEKYTKAAEVILNALPMKSKIESERVIKIDGSISVQPFITHDDFLERFISFVEEQGWYFGGGTEVVTEEE